MTERLHFHFSLSCTGEGNGGPLQSCLENPRDEGAWRAAVYGVAQSWTRLKRLSSSSSSSTLLVRLTIRIICSIVGFLGGASGKEPSCQCRRCKRPGFNPWVGRIPLKEGMIAHSSILAWRIPWTEEPGGLQSIGLQRVRHN